MPVERINIISEPGLGLDERGMDVIVVNPLVFYGDVALSYEDWEMKARSNRSPLIRAHRGRCFCFPHKLGAHGP
jgi:hypothetical protein